MEAGAWVKLVHGQATPVDGLNEMKKKKANKEITQSTGLGNTTTCRANIYIYTCRAKYRDGVLV